MEIMDSGGGHVDDPVQMVADNLVPRQAGVMMTTDRISFFFPNRGLIHKYGYQIVPR